MQPDNFSGLENLPPQRRIACGYQPVPQICLQIIRQLGFPGSAGFGYKEFFQIAYQHIMILISRSFSQKVGNQRG